MCLLLSIGASESQVDVRGFILVHISVYDIGYFHSITYGMVISLARFMSSSRAPRLFRAAMDRCGEGKKA